MLYKKDPLRSRSREPKSQIDIEFERSQSECTFEPITNISRKKSIAKKSLMSSSM